MCCVFMLSGHRATSYHGHQWSSSQAQSHQDKVNTLAESVNQYSTAIYIAQ